MLCVQEAEQEHKEELEKAVLAHQELQEKLESMEKQEQALHAQVGSFPSLGGETGEHPVSLGCFPNCVVTPYQH